MRTSLFSLCLFISIIGNAQVHRNVKRTPYNPQQGQTSSLSRVFTELSQNMVYVSGGTFIMGLSSEEGKYELSSATPAHNVTLSSFYICKYEVTQELWQVVMGSNPSRFIGTKRPVEHISWEDCQSFISRLNSRTGKKYRLPTEAEWEFAARGGTASRNYIYSGSNNMNEVAWYKDNSGNESHNVGSKQPNELGIHDMSGNVAEWCYDYWYGQYNKSAQVNPTGPDSGCLRVSRGGNWNNKSAFCKSLVRYACDPNTRDSCVGFRLALSE